MSTESLLWGRLHAAGLVSSAEPPLVSGTPWYLQVVLAVSAWFAAIFLLFSIAATFSDLLENPGGMIVVGLVCCAVAIFMLWCCRGPKGRDRIFLQQLAMPVSIAGQALVVIGLNQLDETISISRIGMSMLAVGSAMSLASAQPLHRFGSSLHACAGLGAILLDAKHPELLAPLFALMSAAIWLAVARPSSGEPALRPIGYASAFSLLLTVWLVRQPILFSMAFHDAAELPTPLLHSGWAVAGVWFGAALALLLRDSAAMATRVAALAVAALLAVLLPSAPGVLASLMLLVLAFAAGERSLLGVAVAGGLVYLGHYYYEMNVTLIEKAGILAAAGGFLLALRAAMALMWREEKA